MFLSDIQRAYDSGQCAPRLAPAKEAWYCLVGRTHTSYIHALLPVGNPTFNGTIQLGGRLGGPWYDVQRHGNGTWASTNTLAPLRAIRALGAWRIRTNEQTKKHQCAA